MAEARVDALTALANRRACDDELMCRFAEWQRTESTFSLLLVDVDHFKGFNDTHGHQAGDQVLHRVAQVLVATMGEMDFVARYGGEEFLIILPSTTLAEACCAAERARKAISSAVCRWEDTELRVQASVGVSVVGPGDTPRSLFKRGDAALYAAKESGRDRSYFHDGSQSRPVEEAEIVAAKAAAAEKLAPKPRSTAIQQEVDARTDPVTGLPNRRTFSDELRRFVAESRQQQRPVCLLLVGIRRLQHLSTLSGTEAVDHALCEAARMLTATVSRRRPGDAIRLGRIRHDPAAHRPSPRLGSRGSGPRDLSESHSHRRNGHGAAGSYRRRGAVARRRHG